MASILKSMAHPIRMSILLLLDQHQELTVSALIKKLNIRQTAMSQHLQKMKLYGLLGAKRKGKFIFYYLKDKKLVEIIEIAQGMMERRDDII
jgi:ArsR family transcriptional regulator